MAKQILRSDLLRFIINSIQKYKELEETHGKNRSPLIDQIIHNQGGELGSPYCIYGIWQVLDDVVMEIEKEFGVQVIFDLPRTGSSQNLRIQSNPLYACKSPIEASIAIWQRGDSWKGHGGLVLSKEINGLFDTFEFNTSPSDHVERDGEGAYYRIRSMKAVGELQLRGFIDLYRALALKKN